MSDARPFHTLFAGPSDAGAQNTAIVPLDAADLPALEAAAADRGFAFRRVDLGGCDHKPDFLARIAMALDFPDWFGRNWDALADCLGDLAWIDAPGLVVVLEHLNDFKTAAPADCDTALEIITEAAAWHAEGRWQVWVFATRG